MKVVLLSLLVILMAVTVSAQGRFRFAGAYEDSRVPLLKRGMDEDTIKGFNAEADVQVFKLSKFRGSAAYLFEQQNNREVYPFYFNGKEVVDLYRNVRTHYGGAQLGLDLGHAIEPFIAYFVGTEKVHEDAERQVTTKVRVGANVTFTKKSPIFVKGAVDFNRPYGSPNKMMHEPLPAILPAGGFVNPASRMVIIGVGINL